MIYTPKEQIIYVGWLLSCDAPANQAKGDELLEALSPEDKLAALQHSIKLLDLYARA